MGASDVLADRFAIASEGRINEDLSPEDLLSCDSRDYGCGGGYIEKAFQFMEHTGIVTEECFPFTAAQGIEPACATSCSSTSSEYKKYKCKRNSIVHPETPEEIKSEIYQHGPVEASMIIYDDFFNYKSGIYNFVSGAFDGGHAIRILGWGHDDNFDIDYWICANSWGPEWGEQGYFRIMFGECGIEDSVFGCEPDLKSVG